MKKQSPNWHFIDNDGTFQLDDPHHTSYLYFPLVNETGMMSSITPILNGDIKINQNAFLSLPVSMEDLHNTRSARNFWVKMPGEVPWSVTGSSANQTTARYSDSSTETVSMEAGFLWHRITRKHHDLGLQAEVTNFVPASDHRVELMRISITNTSDQSIRFTPTAAVPIYGRSADDVRDHRHVTSLLHRIHCDDFGILVTPTLSFDERGHIPNDLTYTVLGTDGNGGRPVGFFPNLEEFIGEGGTLDWPEAIIKSKSSTWKLGDTIEGFEAIGGLRFEDSTIQPLETVSYIIILGILNNDENSKSLIETFGTENAFSFWLEQTQNVWKDKLDTFGIQTGDQRFDLWMRWVSVQPTLRRLFGNSFLPAHDYGRGGRGWRDLWQDILALLLMEPGDVSEMLFGNFAGVRIDGSNATIIGNKPGEFKADRNNIPRVWMDHGAWPLLTTSLYIHQTGDLAFLLRDQTYFKDHLISRSREVDNAWEPEQDTLLKTMNGETYQGTILEHILIQHLTPFFNVGDHNNILLEGADWNDGMDMASERGESVTFSALYAGNLRQLSEWVLALSSLGVDQVELAAEMIPLLDTLTQPVDYGSVKEKRELLDIYFESCRHSISGEKTQVSIQELANDLEGKSTWLTDHIRKNEWLQNREGYAWFNGYYDNNGERVEGDHPKGPRMTLTGQVFPLMGGVATQEQALAIIKSANRYLLDESVGGYRLNSNFGEVMHNLGRAFGFAFGHKENGAMFSHMAVMYANTLYQRGFPCEGYQVLDKIYQHCQDFKTSRMYPGIPEYINPTGRGMYTWLTGSASWYLLTIVTEVFGVNGHVGDLVLEPKLNLAYFDSQAQATICTLFAGKKLRVTYRNPNHLDTGEYAVQEILLNGKSIQFRSTGWSAILPRNVITDLAEDEGHHLDVLLMDKEE